MEKRILLILGMGDDRAIEQEAFDFAVTHQKQLDVIEVLDSHLYHYGKNDYIIPSYARTQFLYHIQHNLKSDSFRRKTQLKQKAAEKGIVLRYTALETDEPLPHILKILANGYDRLFLPMQKRSWLPLRQPKTIYHRIRETTDVPMTAC